MLAYVFWHAPKPGIDLRQYDADLIDFHATLAQASVPGFVGSQSFRVDGLPWAPAGLTVYEDWYSLRDSAALDRINEAAIGAEARGAHDRLAAASDWGAGGLYRHRSGSVSNGGTVAHWFSRRSGMTYSELDDLLQRALPAGSRLWQRQMVLGPGSEFCATTREDVQTAAGLAAVTVRRRLVEAGINSGGCR